MRRLTVAPRRAGMEIPLAPLTAYAATSPERLEPRRLLSAGDLDPSFGDGGRVLRSSETGAADVVVQGDDKVLLLGNGLGGPTGRDYGFVVDRLNPDGTPDTAFGINGRTLVSFGGSADPASIALQPDGKIVVAGSSGGAIAVARLLPTGAPDPAFSGDGKATLVPAAGYSSRVFDLALQADGKIVLAGTVSSGTSAYGDSLLARVRADGTPDTSFGPNANGFVLQNLGQTDGFTGVALDASGRIVAAAAYDVYGSWGYSVFRYAANGSPDATFGSGGRVRFDTTGTSGDVLVDSAGGILVASVVRGPAHGVARFLPDGSVDRAFGTDGVATAAGLNPPTDRAAGGELAFQMDGKLVLGATTLAGPQYDDTRMAAARFNADGTRDQNFGVGGSAVVPADGTETAEGMDLGMDGHVTLAGRGPGAGMSVVRLDPGPLPLPIRLLPGGIVEVSGTDGNDAVGIARGPRDNFGRPGPLTVTVNSTSRTYPPQTEIREVRVSTGAGADTLTAAAGFATLVSFDAGGGADSAVVNGAAEHYYLTLVNDEVGAGGILRLAGVEALTLRGHDGPDRLVAASYFNGPSVTLEGLGGDDVLVGSTRSERILGGAGNDTIHAREPGGAADTIDGGSGTDRAGYDSADTVTSIETQLNSEIRGLLFNDVDGDGARDADELPLGGWSVYLDADGDGVREPAEAYVTSQYAGYGDGSYNYAVNYLTSGTYAVRAEPPEAGWQATSPSSGLRSVTLSTGQTSTGRNFGYRQTSPNGAISGTVFNDLNNDGSQGTGEPGVAGRTVFLDRDDDGVLDSSETSTVTDASGAYRFSGLPGRAYHVRQSLPAGWRQTEPAQGESLDLNLQPGQSATLPSLGTSDRAGIRGIVFHDRDGDGVQDPGEAGNVGGVTVYLDLDNDGTLDAAEPSAQVGNEGRFSFGGLAAGTYAVRQSFNMSPAPLQTTPAAGSARMVTLGALDAAFDVTLGYAFPVSILGYVFNDANASGGQEGWTVEYGLPGWTVFLDADEDDVLDPGEPSAVTDAQGAFGFEQLRPATYRIRTVVPAGWGRTYPVDGHWFQLSSGNQFTGIPLGVRRTTAAVAGRHVYYRFSAHDGYWGWPSERDDNAIATDKRALLPGQAATFANVTSYAKGINGVMLDLTGLTRAPQASDFVFRMGTGGNPATWAPAPTPTLVHVRGGAGAGGSDRVIFTWADGAIVNKWLQVTVPAGPLARLAQPDVFYFGNLVAEAGDAQAGATPLAVTARDVALTRRNFWPAAGVASRFDFNRDGRVDVFDLALARRAQAAGRVLQLITG